MAGKKKIQPFRRNLKIYSEIYLKTEIELKEVK